MLSATMMKCLFPVRSVLLTQPPLCRLLHILNDAGRPISGGLLAKESTPEAKRTLVAEPAAIPHEREGHISPHGGKLQDLLVWDAEQRHALVASCQHKLQCSERNACDVELLTIGGFSPLQGFMTQPEYQYTVEQARLLGSNLLFGLPVVLDTNDASIKEGSKVLLRYGEQDIAVLEVESKWAPNKPQEAQLCYGSTSIEHPAIKMLTMERGKYYIGGRLWGLELPRRPFHCATPAEVRATLPPGADVVAFQCRNPIHRAHYELFMRALQAPNVRPGAVCLVHPTCGPTQDDDIPALVRYHTYEVLKAEVNNPAVRWAYMPYSMHMAGPREALQHMILRKNYGCTHFIVGRDMAGCKSCITGKDFYGMYDAQDMANKVAPELGMQTVPSLDLVYTEEAGYVPVDQAQARGLHVRKLSGTAFRKMLRGGEDIPEWFAFKSVVSVLRQHQHSQQQ